ncbi:S53 family peptidase [Jatrophihabitans sp. YIM 134969]
MSEPVRTSRWRRPLTAVATLAAAGLAVTALATPATATPVAATPSGTAAHVLTAPHAQKRVCSVAAKGHVACDAHVVTTTDGATPLATTSYQSGYSPAQLTTAYALAGATGSATVAVVDAYASPNAAADLAAYRTQFGLGTANLTQYNQTGGTTLPAGDTGWGSEEMLDLEMVSAICPSCSIVYVGANSTSFADLGTAVNTAVAKGAKVVSNSYGGSESSGESAYASYYNHPGVAITVSSGDDGYGVQSPASFNTVTAVGGTNLVLNSDNTRKTETAWSGAGSGCSRYISKPSWQHDTGCSKRTVADVSAVADPNTGVAVYDSYGSSGGANWFVYGGTSVAAPIIGAVYARSGNTSGVPASVAYSNTGSLYDVTSGSNGRCSTKYLCTGVSGYDGPTGLGTPKGVGAF